MRDLNMKIERMAPALRGRRRVANALRQDDWEAPRKVSIFRTSNPARVAL